jgi:hypothetical protein
MRPLWDPRGACWRHWGDGDCDGRATLAAYDALFGFVFSFCLLVSAFLRLSFISLPSCSHTQTIASPYPS